MRRKDYRRLASPTTRRLAELVGACFMPETIEEDDSPMQWTGIGGTHDYGRGIWYYCDSPFAAWMAQEGFACVRRNGPFWSGGLAGVPFLAKREWRFGASILYEWMHEKIPDVRDRNIISVSHGGQVAFMAAADGLLLNSLVTITMPQRADMEEVYRAALPNIGTYTNVYSDSWWRDKWQILGTLTDGAFRFRRTFELDDVPGADIENIGIKGVGHTDLVRTNKMALLKSSGVLARLL